MVTVIVLAFQASAWAGCRLDCDNEFSREACVCQFVHPNPLDFSDLEMCIGNSQDVYNKCMAGCVYAPSP
jgi:hypothetical protein